MLARASEILSALTFFSLCLTHPPLTVQLSLAALIAAWLLRLWLRAEVWLLYALTGGVFLSLGNALQGLSLFANPAPFAIPLVLGYPLAGLWILAQRRQSPFARHYEVLNGILLGLHSLVLAGFCEQWIEGRSESLVAATTLGLAALPWLLWLNGQHKRLWLLFSTLCQALLLSCLLLFRFGLAALPLAALPWLFEALRRRESEAKGLYAAAALLSPFALLWSYLTGPAQAQMERLPDLLVILGSTLLLALWSGLYVDNTCRQPQHKWFWSLSALWLNFSWFYLLTTLVHHLHIAPHERLPDLLLSILGWQSILFVPGLSLVSLAYFTLSKQPDRNQLLYLGLSLIMLSPSLGLLARDSYLGSQNGLFLLLGLQILGLIWLCFWTGLRLRTRAFVQMGLFCLALILLGALLLLLLKGHWSLRWGLFIGTGMLLIVGGNLIQSRHADLRQKPERLQVALLDWN